VVLDLLFPVLTSDHSNEREKELEDGGGAGEGRATAAAATSALAAATAASRCKESCSRGKGQWRRAEGRRVTRKRKIWAGKKEERGWRMGKGKERPTSEERRRDHGLGSEASQRRQDRRRQPAITSWNVWERVGLDPKGPTTTKSPSSRPFPPIPSTSTATL